MIKIALRTEPCWLSLPGFTDLRLRVRPLTTALFAMARAKAQRTVADLGPHLRAAREAGAVVDVAPFDPDDAVAVEALLDAELIRELARAAILAWEGVADADGNPAPVTDRTVGDLMSLFPIGHRFRDAYLLSDLLLDAEKNACSPAPAGTSQAASDIAATAATAAGLAPGAAPVPTAASAPTPSTSP